MFWFLPKKCFPKWRKAHCCSSHFPRATRCYSLLLQRLNLKKWYTEQDFWDCGGFSWRLSLYFHIVWLKLRKAHKRQRSLLVWARSDSSLAIKHKFWSECTVPSIWPPPFPHVPHILKSCLSSFLFSSLPVFPAWVVWRLPLLNKAWVICCTGITNHRCRVNVTALTQEGLGLMYACVCVCVLWVYVCVMGGKSYYWLLFATCALQRFW